MSNELEGRLRALLSRLPPSSAAVEERALAAAIAALPEAHAVRGHRSRTLALALAAALSVLAVAAGALAAVGALHVSLGGTAATSGTAPAPRLLLPRGARGIAAVVDGRLWLTSRGGLRIEGLPVQSATLSPHALYVAAGIGDSLVVMAPSGTRAWSHGAGGRVVAIAWAPSGLRIAYVVERPDGTMQLRTIEGDGDHDRLLDAAVRPVAPSWRADSLAIAYVGAGGRPVVYDLERNAHRLVAPGPAAVTAIAFAPQGRVLAVVAGQRLSLDGAPQSVGVGRDAIVGIAWTGERLAVASDASDGHGVVRRFRLGAGGVIEQSRTAVGGRITAIGAAGVELVVAVQGRHSPTRLVAIAATGPGSHGALLEVERGATVAGVAVR